MHHSALFAALAAVILATPAGAQHANATVAVDTGAAHRDSVAAVMTPATGTYNCVRTVWAGHPGGSFRFESQGLLTLDADGSYTFDRSNRKGTYTVVPAMRKIEWSGGYFADKGAQTATFGTEGAPHVEILFHERDGDTRWVCAKGTAQRPAGSARPATKP